MDRVSSVLVWMTCVVAVIASPVDRDAVRALGLMDASSFKLETYGSSKEVVLRGSERELSAYLVEVEGDMVELHVVALSAEKTLDLASDDIRVSSVATEGGNLHYTALMKDSEKCTTFRLESDAERINFSGRETSSVAIKDGINELTVCASE